MQTSGALAPGADSAAESVEIEDGEQALLDLVGPEIYSSEPDFGVETFEKLKRSAKIVAARLKSQNPVHIARIKLEEWDDIKTLLANLMKLDPITHELK